MIQWRYIHSNNELSNIITRSNNYQISHVFGGRLFASVVRTGMGVLAYEVFLVVTGLNWLRFLLVTSSPSSFSKNHFFNLLCVTLFLTNFFTILSLTNCKFLQLDLSSICSNVVYSAPKLYVTLSARLWAGLSSLGKWEDSPRAGHPASGH